MVSTEEAVFAVSAVRCAAHHRGTGAQSGWLPTRKVRVVSVTGRKLAVIHQPNDLPGLTYFDKMARCDVFIVLDDVQYPKNNWTNRNQIKTPQGAQWLSVPVINSGRFGQRITDTLPDNQKGWQQKHVRTIELNYRRAPGAARLAPALSALIMHEWVSLADMNVALIEFIARELQTTPQIIRSSDLAVPGTSTEKLLNLCRAVGATSYLTGPGGLKYMDTALFRSAGIDLLLHEFQHPEYRQLHGPFIPNLSAIDLLLNEDERAAHILHTATPSGITPL